MNTCEMILMESGDLDYLWECSSCLSRHKDTQKFEKSTVCPSCGAEIKDWIGFEEEEER